METSTSVFTQTGELVPGLQVLDAVQNETVQIGQTCGYYTGKNPVLAFDTCVPFGMTARQQQAWLGEGGGGKLMAEVFSDFGIRSFPSGTPVPKWVVGSRKSCQAWKD